MICSENLRKLAAEYLNEARAEKDERVRSLLLRIANHWKQMAHSEDGQSVAPSTVRRQLV